MASFLKSTCAAIAYLFTSSQVMWHFGRKVPVYLEKCRLISLWSLPPTESILRVRTSRMTFFPSLGNKKALEFEIFLFPFIKKNSNSKRKLELSDTRSVFVDSNVEKWRIIQSKIIRPNPYSRTSKFKSTDWTFLQKDGSGGHGGILFNALQLLKYTEATWALIARNEERNACHHC